MFSFFTSLLGHQMWISHQVMFSYHLQAVLGLKVMQYTLIFKQVIVISFLLHLTSLF